MHHYQDLITIFNDCFTDMYKTKLVKGGEEPLYLPADEQRPYHEIYFAHGFYSSALHECAHWLIAGPERRKQIDFGYWYEPEGRTAEQQTLFQSYEVKPQALEWVLSAAAGHPFRISVDNLGGPECDLAGFKQAIHQQVKYYCNQGLSVRAALLRSALCRFYGKSYRLNIDDFDIETIG